MNCATCKFWGPLAYLLGWEKARHCSNPNLLAMGGNDDGLADVFTLPEFGCIQWQSSPNSDEDKG